MLAIGGLTSPGSCSCDELAMVTPELALALGRGGGAGGVGGDCAGDGAALCTFPTCTGLVYLDRGLRERGCMFVNQNNST